MSSGGNGKEDSCLGSSYIVCPKNIEDQADNIINVDVMHFARVNGDVNNQLFSLPGRNVVVKKCPVGN